MEGVKYHIRELTDKDAQCICGPYAGCPQIYEIVSTDCGPIIGCPQIYGIKSTECGPALGCPTIFNDPENKDVYLIVGKQMKPEEFEGLAGKVGVGEAVIAIPKSLVDKLSERK